MLALSVSTKPVEISGSPFGFKGINISVISTPGILKKWQLVFYGTDTNPIRLRSPQTPRPAFPNVGGGAATIGRDVHGLTAPPSVATPFAPTFKSVGHAPNPAGSQLFFPGNPGFRPSNFPNTGYPDFLQFAGSQAVTYSTSLEATQSSNVGTKNNCPTFSLDGYFNLILQTSFTSLLYLHKCFLLTEIASMPAHLQDITSRQKWYA